MNEIIKTDPTDPTVESIMDSISKEFAVSDPDLSHYTAEELREELIKIAGITAKAIRRAASLVAELTRRGEDVPKLSIFGEYIHMVAGGMLHEEVVARFIHNRPLLNKIKSPAFGLREQVRIATGEVKVPVLVDNYNHEPTIERKAAVELKPAEISRAFDSHGFRSIEDQKRLIARTEASRRRVKCRLRIDPETKILKYGNSFVRKNHETISYTELVAVLSEYTSLDLDKYIVKNAPVMP